LLWPNVALVGTENGKTSKGDRTFWMEYSFVPFSDRGVTGEEECRKKKVTSTAPMTNRTRSTTGQGGED